MKIKWLSPGWVLVFTVILVLGGSVYAETVTEGNVTITVSRVLTGAKTGIRYYGHSGGRIELPHDRGGVISFHLWNDLQLNGTAHTNFFNTIIAGKTIQISNYATKHQIQEEYKEFNGDWGAAGVYRYTLAIPPGTKSIEFNTSGSPTGMELSNPEFSGQYRPLPQGYDHQAVRPFGDPVVQVARALKGTASGRTYYGYLQGTVHLPNGDGGTLSFNFYNDQQVGFHSTLNRINLSVGTDSHTAAQYTTSMDLQEQYEGLEGQWGPAGGAFLSIPIVLGITRMDFNHQGSQTGIEITGVQFSQGKPVPFRFNEQVNRTTDVLKSFSRVLHGQRSKKTFYGFTSGSIILPHSKGGTLSFTFWNDHHANASKTSNQLHITAGSVNRIVHQTTWQADRWEFYEEFSGQWGPAGGKPVRISVPPGTGSVSFSNSGSNTGFELSDLMFTQ